MDDKYQQSGRPNTHCLFVLYSGGCKLSVEDAGRKDIATYVEHLHGRGLVMTPEKNLHTVYAFIQYLVDKEVLQLDILPGKIRIKLPEVLPEHLQQKICSKF